MSGKGNGIGMTVSRALVGLAITFATAAAVADAAQTPASARLYVGYLNRIRDMAMEARP